MKNKTLRHEILNRKLEEGGEYVSPTAMRFINEAMEEYAQRRANFISSNLVFSLVFVRRIIGFPFFAVLAFIGAMVLFGKYLINYLRFGGEALTYTHKRNPKTIADLLADLQKDKN